MNDRGLLFLHALTSLHPGTGTALGVVDLPVQRERHTQWPIIPGSSIKGVLRDRCRVAVRNGGSLEEANRDANLVRAFGPPGEDKGLSAGALAFTDARLAAFPVRSARGIFGWITCPAVLERMNRDLSMAGHSGISVPAFTNVAGKALLRESSPLLLSDRKHVLLEEFQFERIGDIGPLGRELGAICTKDQATRDRLETHLLVLADDDFTHFVQHATEITARIALDYETKTVKDGALFYQEFLPSESLFYSVVLSAAGRIGAGQAFEFLRNHLPSVLQIGGNETTGKGICAAYLSVAVEAK
jgi:CRISPR-associated protein Cmr4